MRKRRARVSNVRRYSVLLRARRGRSTRPTRLAVLYYGCRISPPLETGVIGRRVMQSARDIQTHTCALQIDLESLLRPNYMGEPLLLLLYGLS